MVILTKIVNQDFLTSHKHCPAPNANRIIDTAGRSAASVDFAPRDSYIESSVQGATVSAERAEPTWSYVVFTLAYFL